MNKISLEEQIQLNQIESLEMVSEDQLIELGGFRTCLTQLFSHLDKFDCLHYW
jgi:hypothetical protein